MGKTSKEDEPMLYKLLMLAKKEKKAEAIAKALRDKSPSKIASQVMSLRPR